MGTVKMRLVQEPALTNVGKVKEDGKGRWWDFRVHTHTRSISIPEFNECRASYRGQ